METLDRNAQSSMLPQGLADQFDRRTFLPAGVVARQQWKYTPLIQVPAYSLRLVAAGANAMLDVDLPDNISVLAFRALSTVDFCVGFGVRASMPPAMGQRSGDFVPNDAIQCPLDLLFYVKGLRSISVGIAAAGAVVSVVGWTQLG